MRNSARYIHTGKFKSSAILEGLHSVKGCILELSNVAVHTNHLGRLLQKGFLLLLEALWGWGWNLYFKHMSQVILL